MWYSISFSHSLLSSQLGGHWHAKVSVASPVWNYSHSIKNMSWKDPSARLVYLCLFQSLVASHKMHASTCNAGWTYCMMHIALGIWVRMSIVCQWAWHTAPIGLRPRMCCQSEWGRSVQTWAQGSSHTRPATTQHVIVHPNFTLITIIETLS